MTIVFHLSVACVVGLWSKALAFSQPLRYHHYVQQKTDVAQRRVATSLGVKSMGDFDFAVGILGDLHIDPRKLEDYIESRDQIYDAFLAHPGANHVIVSLGDLGESKNCDHNTQNPSELFAGTTLCHEMAAEYLNSFQLPYEVVTGNHGESETVCYSISYP